MSSKEGGGGIVSTEKSMDESIQGLEDNIKKEQRKTNNSDKEKHNDQQKGNINWKKRKLYGYFKWLTNEISHEKTWTMQRRRNLKRKTVSILIEPQNDIRTNYVKAKKDKTQQNSKDKLCDAGDETINYIISECNKLPTGWERWSTENCAINLDLTKLTNYKYKSEFVLKNETQQILCNLKLQTELLIRWLTEKKRTCCLVDFDVPWDHRVILKQNEKRGKYFDFARELKSNGTWRWQCYHL